MSHKPTIKVIRNVKTVHYTSIDFCVFPLLFLQLFNFFAVVAAMLPQSMLRPSPSKMRFYFVLERPIFSCHLSLNVVFIAHTKWNRKKKNYTPHTYVTHTYISKLLDRTDNLKINKSNWSNYAINLWRIKILRSTSRSTSSFFFFCSTHFITSWTVLDWFPVYSNWTINIQWNELSGIARIWYVNSVLVFFYPHCATFQLRIYFLFAQLTQDFNR